MSGKKNISGDNNYGTSIKQSYRRNSLRLKYDIKRVTAAPVQTEETTRKMTIIIVIFVLETLLRYSVSCKKRIPGFGSELFSN